MKKVLALVSVVFIASFMLTSCGGKAEKIKVSKLEDACDHVDAMITIGEAKLSLVEDNNKYDMSMEDMRKKDYLEYKMMMVQSHAREAEIDYKDMEDCENWKELEDLEEKIDDARKSANKDED